MDKTQILTQYSWLLSELERLNKEINAHSKKAPVRADYSTVADFLAALKEHTEEASALRSAESEVGKHLNQLNQKLIGVALSLFRLEELSADQISQQLDCSLETSLALQLLITTIQPPAEAGPTRAKPTEAPAFPGYSG